MDFEQYQNEAGRFAVYPNRGSNLTYATLGLAGEAGEVADKVKKIIRDKNGVITDEVKTALQAELGDVLWYVAAMCHELGVSMDEVANLNLDKLTSRAERNKLHGSGDNR